LDFGGGDEQPVREAIAVTLACAAAGDHDDAVAAAAPRGLHDESVTVRDDVAEAAYFGLVGDDTVQFRYRHAGFDGELLRQYLVVDPGIEPPRVEPHDEIGVALVQSEHPRFTQ